MIKGTFSPYILCAIKGSRKTIVLPLIFLVESVRIVFPFMLHFRRIFPAIKIWQIRSAASLFNPFPSSLRPASCHYFVHL
ncbi:hypothetical protein BC629DRAFT_368893 [Irpex lacteus]|nr:hypothetical protein BC629DRAFT_368893 [Irpex lacteus]